MGKANGLIALAAGFGGGYLKQTQQNLENEERKQKSDQDKQLFDLKIDEANREKNLRVSLADATRPATVEAGANGMIKPDSMDNRDVGLAENAAQPNMGLMQAGFKTGGKAYDTQAAADGAAATYNKPEAVSLRQASAYGAAGQPDKAMAMEDRAAKMANDKREFAKRALQEGYEKTGKLMLNGSSPALVRAAFNGQGGEQAGDDLVMTEKMLDLGGGKKIKTYDYTGTLISPDGTKRQGTVNSHEFNFNMLGYKDQMDSLRKDADSDNKFTYQSGLLDAKNEATRARLEAANSKELSRAIRGIGGGDKGENVQSTHVGKDGTLFAVLKNGSVKPLLDAENNPMGTLKGEVRLDKMTKDIAGQPKNMMKPYEANRETAAQIVRGVKPQVSLSDATKPASGGAAAPTTIKTKAERDALPEGARYTGLDGVTYVKK